ncbi:MAG: hypothetical protein U5K69_15895 [Balneolaceae bacterium]|nr:hypothetical protein [Balneolaceae bacterium]
MSGHWSDPEVINDIDTWIRAAIGKHELSNMKVARFGDNMRNVAVTEGDKVSAEIQFGLDVKGFGVGDLVEYIKAVDSSDLDQAVSSYTNKYQIASKDSG